MDRFSKMDILKMSKIEKPKKVLKKAYFFTISDHYALNDRKNEFQFVIINFYIFLKKTVKNKI